MHERFGRGIGMSQTIQRFAFSALLFGLAMVPIAHAQSPAPAAAPKTYRVMFIGNSLTYVNNLPGMVRALAAAQPAPVHIETQTFVAPGGSLAERWQDGAAAKALDEGHWDALVLQERGGLMACMLDPDQRSTSDCRMSERAHREFAARAKAVGARTYVLATWGPDDSWQARLDRAAKQMAGRIDAAVIPAGTTLRHYANQHGEKKAFPDGTHPSLPATVIMAAQVYRALVGSDAQAADVTIDFWLLPPDAALQPANPIESQPHLQGTGMVFAAAAVAPLLAEAKP
jgi:hypothetical protein